ncbi:MAG: OmpA family protein [Bacteroidales bacterium]|nr:OmpA family protein [Bacteroidales bacterium]
MLKKLLKVGLVASLLIASTNLFAQESTSQRYGNSSHWAFGGAVSYNHQFNQGGFLDWGVASNAGGGIFVQKKFRHDLDFRFRFNWPSLIAKMDSVSDKSGNVMDNHASLTIEMLYSINNGILGYDPDRRFSWYALIGAGPMFSFNAMGAFNGYWGVGITAGTGISYRFTDHSSLFLEYTIDFTDIPNVFQGNTEGLNGIISLGYFYDWGASATDQAIMAQKSMLSQENFSALNSQVSTLENQVAASKSNEKKLENRIAELENELREARKATTPQPVDNGEVEKRLKAAIDQLKADQLNFYAMPFSIQYDVNEWQVSEEQMDKIDAVAKVMKNTDAKFMIVGFADYSGSDNYNQKLSERRANEVKRLLKQKGVSEDKLTVEGKGKTAPFGDIKLPVNRRVSFYRVIE